jgi:hypothetical protein
LTERAVWQLVREYAAQIGIGELAPHDLRRTAAKLCRSKGGELEQIQFLLGHESILTTERYLGSEQDLRMPSMTRWCLNEGSMSSCTDDQNGWRAGEELLSKLVSLLRPRRLVAIGNDAAKSAAKVCQSSEVVRVRHPSYGGQTQFLNTMNRHYSLRQRAPTPERS